MMAFIETRWCISFTDDHTRVGWISLKEISEAKMIFKIFKL